jgi:RsiW-degrading membrane proteinase PrsW (M82 family)
MAWITSNAVLIVSLVVAFAIPCVYLYFGVYQRDFFQTSNTSLMLYCFLWGAVAYVLAAQINSTALNNFWISRDNLVRYWAPILEEILKGAILIYLVRRADFTYFVDGAIYGFTTGIGFAVFENMEYVFGHPNAALGLALARVFSTNLIHATACGSIGIALGYSRFEQAGSRRRSVILLVSALMAMSLHMAFNNMVDRGAPIFLAFVVGLSGFGFIIYVILRGMKELQLWVNEELQQEQAVTVNEASIINEFERVDKILAPFARRFGPQKAALAREMLLWQAQLGIERKKAEKHQDEKMRRAASAQVVELRRKMDENRKKLGWYCMLQLRGIFPEEGNPWWERMQAMEQAPKELAGTGVWMNLDKKMKQADANGPAEAK